MDSIVAVPFEKIDAMSKISKSVIGSDFSMKDNSKITSSILMNNVKVGREYNKLFKITFIDV